MKRFVFLYSVVFLLVFYSCSFVSVKLNYEEEKSIKTGLDTIKTVNVDKAKTLKTDFKNKLLKLDFPPYTKIDTVVVDNLNKLITINFSKELSYIALREDNVKSYYSILKEYLGNDYSSYNLIITSLGIKIEDLIPNLYRTSLNYDFNRVRDFNFKRTTPIIENINKPFKITKGLYNRNIALWHSHGWYYSVDANRWEWQRPRLFQTVEDLVPLSFVIPYIAP
ncbi:MAG TPA: hypothetical protein PL041_14955, partial [Melioribacteraceae bacterium]|nr:hypothetical protein [Melioribacteraceae bacterium]